MSEADEFLDRVDRTLWAVKGTPFDGGLPVYVKIIPVLGGQYVHVDEPFWMNYEAAMCVINEVSERYRRHYRIELLPQMRMKHESVD